MSKDICCTLYLDDYERRLIISALECKISLYNEFIELNKEDGLLDICEDWQSRIDLAHTLIDFMSV